jgi:phosphocarrier protein
MPDSLNPQEGGVRGSVTLVHAAGMHARPAVKLTKLAKKFAAQIAFRVAGTADWVDAKSIVKVMAVRAARDSTLEFEASGPDARAAIDALVALVAEDFPETGA